MLVEPFNVVSFCFFPVLDGVFSDSQKLWVRLDVKLLLSELLGEFLEGLPLEDAPLRAALLAKVLLYDLQLVEVQRGYSLPARS